MRHLRSRYSVVWTLWLASASAAAAPAGLADAGARLSFGYYHVEPAVVRAAADALERMPDGPEVDYHRALAALRLAELGVEDRDLLERCIGIGESFEGADALALEASVLVAACSTLAAQRSAIKGMLHQRRRDEALARVLAVEPNHPRALWVAAWGDDLDAVRRGELPSEAVRETLEAAAAAFRDGAAGDPSIDWGHAETFAHLGAAALAAGDVRRGRDLLEQALLEAPGYVLAVELMGRVGARSVSE